MMIMWCKFGNPKPNPSLVMVRTSQFYPKSTVANDLERSRSILRIIKLIQDIPLMLVYTIFEVIVQTSSGNEQTQTNGQTDTGDNNTLWHNLPRSKTELSQTSTIYIYV